MLLFDSSCSFYFFCEREREREEKFAVDVGVVRFGIKASFAGKAKQAIHFAYYKFLLSFIDIFVIILGSFHLLFVCFNVCSSIRLVGQTNQWTKTATEWEREREKTRTKIGYRQQPNTIQTILNGNILWKKYSIISTTIFTQ